jgi:hypothetical protein
VITLTMTWRIVEYRGRSGLERLEDDWRRLYAEMPARSRYHAYEAHLAYAGNFMAAPDRLRYLALSDGERVRAICPLEAAQDTSLRIPIPVWRLPWHLHWRVTDVLCPDSEARKALIPAVARFLRQDPEGRRLLVLGPLPEDSDVWDGLHGMRPGEYCLHMTRPSFFLDCETTYDELLGGLTKHFRRNLRSHRNKLESLEDVRFVTASGRAGLEALGAELNAFMTVEASGWKGQGGTGSAVRLHPELAAFYRDLAAAISGSEDRCEINSLYVEGRCVASQFCVRTGQDYAILKIGYDEAYARLGPGQLLFDTTLERCCSDPEIKRLDLVGDASWCKDWHTAERSMQQAHVAIGRWSGRPLVALVRFRFDRGRRIVGWLRDRDGRRGDDGGAKDGASPARGQGRP